MYHSLPDIIASPDTTTQYALFILPCLRVNYLEHACMQGGVLYMSRETADDCNGNPGSQEKITSLNCHLAW